MKNIINCTPHAVNVIVDGVTTVIPASGIVPRCKQDTVQIGSVLVDGSDIPITRTQFGVVEDLPDATDGTLLIVSMLVAKACPDRDDLVIPNGIVRDADGNIIGCTSLATV
jgi:hypothetical protein